MFKRKNKNLLNAQDSNPPLDQPDIPLEEFVHRLKFSGRIFPGSFGKAEYIASHKAELDAYLDSIRKKDKSEAKLIEQMIRLNSQVRGADPTTLEQRSDARDMYSGVGREHRSFRLTTPGYGRYGLHSKLTTYSSIPRKVAERFISGGAILAVACALGYASFKLGQIINKKLGPLAERLTPYYNDIDHRK